MISIIQYFEADFLWKVSLKILNSELILTASIRTYRDNANYSLKRLTISIIKLDT